MEFQNLFNSNNNLNDNTNGKKDSEGYINL